MCIGGMIQKSWRYFNCALSAGMPVADLTLRYWLWSAFFYSGWNKWQSFETTIQLFTYEYEVPFVSPWLAAFSGTLVEIAVPIFILIGLGGRLPAFILFIFNITAVWAYPFLWTEEGALGMQDHIYWGMMLLVLMTYGTKQFSVDYLMKSFCCKNACQK